MKGLGEIQYINAHASVQYSSSNMKLNDVCDSQLQRLSGFIKVNL